MEEGWEEGIGGSGGEKLEPMMEAVVIVWPRGEEGKEGTLCL